MDKFEMDLELDRSFSETYRMTVENHRLNESMKRSAMLQSVIPETEEYMNIPVPHKKGDVIISRKKSLEAASTYKGKKIAVLNFASALTPGGGSHMKGRTQEECLCRESTLYSCISAEQCQEHFYRPHKDLDPLYNADMIYTPYVTVFKNSDNIPSIMPEEDWFDVNVITMAAPNMKQYDGTIEDEQIIKLFETRFERIVKEAMRHNIEVLILGAFGCGEFGNDPALVATAAARVLENYRGAFDTTEFAMYEGKGRKNYRMFRLVLDRYLNNP